MGTRGAWGFRKNGTIKATYNHFDSYPTELGNVMRNFIVNNSIEDIEKAFDNLKFVKSDETPTEEDFKKYSKYLNTNVNGGAKQWYNLLREVQGQPQVYIDDPGLNAFIDSTSFMSDELFCEWSYIINLDNKVLEVYTDGNNLIGSIPFNELKNYDLSSLE